MPTKKARSPLCSYCGSFKTCCDDIEAESCDNYERAHKDDTPVFTRGLRVGDTIVSRSKKDVIWRKNDRFAIFLGYYHLPGSKAVIPTQALVWDYGSMQAHAPSIANGYDQWRKCSRKEFREKFTHTKTKVRP